jgi:NitT/TauT family transport system permease protein
VTEAVNPSNLVSSSADALLARKRPSRLSALRGQVRLVVLPVVAAALVIGGWEAVVRIKQIPNTLLPAPSAVAIRLTETLPFLLHQAIPTTLETIASFLISMVLGISLAVLICKSRLMRDALYPNIVLFQLIPKIALAPLFIVWLGIGSTSRITFGVFISFFPVVVATLTGLMSVDRDLLRLCKAVGADESRIYAIGLILYGLIVMAEALALKKYGA